MGSYLRQYTIRVREILRQIPSPTGFERLVRLPSDLPPHRVQVQSSFGAWKPLVVICVPDCSTEDWVRCQKMILNFYAEIPCREMAHVILLGRAQTGSRAERNWKNLGQFRVFNYSKDTDIRCFSPDEPGGETLIPPGSVRPSKFSRTWSPENTDRMPQVPTSALLLIDKTEPFDIEDLVSRAVEAGSSGNRLFRKVFGICAVSIE